MTTDTNHTPEQTKQLAGDILGRAAQRYSARMDSESRGGFTRAYAAAGRAGFTLDEANAIVRNATPSVLR